MATLKEQLQYIYIELKCYSGSISTVSQSLGMSEVWMRKVLKGDFVKEDTGLKVYIAAKEYLQLKKEKGETKEIISKIISLEQEVNMLKEYCGITTKNK